MRTVLSLGLGLFIMSAVACTTTAPMESAQTKQKPQPQRTVASRLDVGDDTIQAGLSIPLYKDQGDLNTQGMMISVKQQPSASNNYESCSGMISPGNFKLKRSGSCVDVSWESDSRVKESVRYCEHEKMQADGRKFEVVEVMDKCLRHPKDRNDGKYANLYLTSPIIRLKAEDGQVYITEALRLNKLMQINNTHVVTGTGQCGKKHTFGRAKPAMECAVETAKKYVGDICTALQGKAQTASLKEVKAPYMCYTEPFAEEYCASYSVQCDF